MQSHSYHTWIHNSAEDLDEIAAAHVAISGTGPGRRHATAQINYAYAVMLCSHFQRYCRNLHSECADCLARSVGTVVLQKLFVEQMTRDRKLDHGNPTPGNIGGDFARFGVQVWPLILAAQTANGKRKQTLELLLMWRNAIAHQDFDPIKLGGRTKLSLQDVRIGRRAVSGIARTMDDVMKIHLKSVLGASPW